MRPIDRTDGRGNGRARASRGLKQVLWAARDRLWPPHAQIGEKLRAPLHQESIAHFREIFEFDSVTMKSF